MTSIDDLARRVMSAFFQTPRKAGDAFWSVRDISLRFECTEYFALEVLKKLTVGRYIKRVPGKGCFLEDRVDMTFLALTTARRHPGIVPPLWGEASDQNVWTDYMQVVTAETRRRQWNLTFFSDHNWGDIGFTAQFKLAGCNALITIDPKEDSLVTFTELRRDSIPILVIGSDISVYETLGIATIDSHEQAAMKDIFLRLFNEYKVENPLVLTYAGGPTVRVRHKGCIDAYTEAKRSMPYDIFMDGPEDKKFLIKYLQDRLKSPAPPDALICHESAILDDALTEWPGLLSLLKRKKIPVVVFDDLHIAVKWPSLRILNVTHPTEEVALRSLHIIERLLNGQSVPRRTLVPRTLHWEN